MVFNETMIYNVDDSLIMKTWPEMKAYRMEMKGAFEGEVVAHKQRSEVDQINIQG